VSLCDPLRQEVVRVELLGVGELIRVPMEEENMSKQNYSSGHFVTSCKTTTLL
jgi:hypothetical protein